MGYVGAKAVFNYHYKNTMTNDRMSFKRRVYLGINDKKMDNIITVIKQ